MGFTLTRRRAHLKKLLLSLVIIMAMIFLYSYQLPIISREEAIVSAEKHLRNPPKEWENRFSNIDWNDTPLENIGASLNQRKDFWVT